MTKRNQRKLSRTIYVSVNGLPEFRFQSAVRARAFVDSVSRAHSVTVYIGDLLPLNMMTARWLSAPCSIVDSTARITRRGASL